MSTKRTFEMSNGRSEVLAERAIGSGLRTLHVLVPEEAFTRAHIAALESRPQLRFGQFIATLLANAKPVIGVSTDADAA
jgi:hypothetical protein